MRGRDHGLSHCHGVPATRTGRTQTWCRGRSQPACVRSVPGRALKTKARVRRRSPIPATARLRVPPRVRIRTGLARTAHLSEKRTAWVAGARSGIHAPCPHPRSGNAPRARWTDNLRRLGFATRRLGCARTLALVTWRSKLKSARSPGHADTVPACAADTS